MSLRSVYHRVNVFFLPAVLIVVFFARLFIPQPSLFMIPDFGQSDVLHLNLPLKKILSDALTEKRWPLWSSDINSGFPMLAEGQLGTFFLPNLILFRFFPFVTAYNLGLLIAFITAFAGSYLLFTRLGFTRIISSFCAAVFTFSGFFPVHLSHYNLLQTATMFPLVFWAALALYRHPTYLKSVVFAFLSSQQVFAGYLPMVFITLVAIAIWWVVSLFIDKHAFGVIVTRCSYLVLTFVLSVGFSAIQLVPTIELWQRSFRSTGLNFEAVTAYPYPPQHLITFLFPFFFGSPADGSYPRFNDSWGIFWENTAYIGILPLMVAIIGAVMAIKHRAYLPFLFILFFSLLLITGKYSPLYLLFGWPPFSLFRVPSRFLLVTLLSLCVLLGWGLTNIVNILQAKIKSTFIVTHIVISIAYLFFIADGFLFSYHYPPVSLATLWLEPPAITQSLTPAAQITSIGAPQQWNEVFLQKGWRDITPYVYFKNNLYPKSMYLYGFKGTDFAMGGINPKRQGYFTSIGRNIDFDDHQKVATLSAQTLNILSLSATDFITSPYKLKGENVEEVQLIEDASGRFDPVRLYRLRTSVPQAYLVFNTQMVTTLEEVSREFSDPLFLERGTVLVEKENLIMTSSRRSTVPVSITIDEPSRLTAQVDTPEKSLLVVARNNYPGWIATIDGNAASIEYVNLTQSGIVVPKGKYQIEFRYLPASFQTGRQVTITTAIAVFVFIIIKRLKWKL